MWYARNSKNEYYEEEGKPYPQKKQINVYLNDDIIFGDDERLKAIYYLLVYNEFRPNFTIWGGFARKVLKMHDKTLTEVQEEMHRIFTALIKEYDVFDSFASSCEYSNYGGVATAYTFTYALSTEITHYVSDEAIGWALLNAKDEEPYKHITEGEDMAAVLQLQEEVQRLRAELATAQRERDDALRAQTERYEPVPAVSQESSKYHICGQMKRVFNVNGMSCEVSESFLATERGKRWLARTKMQASSEQRREELRRGTSRLQRVSDLTEENARELNNFLDTL